MSLKKGISYVFLANLVNLVVSLFSGFILPKMLSITTYADIKLFQLYISYLGALSLGYADGMYLRLGGKDINTVNKKEIKEELNTYKLFQFIVFIVFILFSIFIKNKILFFCTLVLLPINVSGYYRNFYQAIGNFKSYSKFTNINTLSIFFINLFLLLIIKSNSSSIYIFGYVVAYFIYWFLIEFEIRKIISHKNKKISIKYFIKDVKDGILLMIGNFCNVIFTGIDRLFVQKFIGIAQFAFYSFAVGIENLLNVFITPISTVMYNYFCKNNEKQKVINIKRVVILFTSILVTCFFPAKFIVINYIDKYQQSLKVLSLLIISQFFSIPIKCIQINLFKSLKEQKKYFCIVISVVILSTILNIIFLNIYNSIEFIALATLLSNFIWFIIGEITLYEYKMKVTDYVFMLAVLSNFIFMSFYINNAIIGLVVYIIFTILLSFIFMYDSIKQIFPFLLNFINDKICKSSK